MQSSPEHAAHRDRILVVRELGRRQGQMLCATGRAEVDAVDDQIGG
jgi:hypothetical protein